MNLRDGAQILSSVGRVHLSRRRVATLRAHGPTLAALAVSLPAGFSLSNGERELSGPQVATLVRGLAAEWQARGVGPGESVAVLARGLEAAVGILAGSLTGADVIAVDPRLPAPELEAVLASASAGALAVGESIQVPALLMQMSLRLTTDPGQVRADLPLARHRGGRCLVHTSGTTGTPTVQGRSRYGAPQLVPALDLARHLRLGPRRSVLLTPPLWHGYGLGILSLAMLCGAPVVLPTSNDPVHLQDLLSRSRAPVVVSVPPSLAALAHHRRDQGVPAPFTEGPQSGRAALPLDAIVSGSGPLTPEVAALVMDTFGDVLFNLYGTTEGGWTAVATPADLRAAPGTVGRAAAGTRLRVVEGEVQTRSPLTTSPVAAARQDEGYHPTGDLGYLDAAGRLFVTGRRDAMVVLGGVNVVLPRVEEELRRVDGIGDAVVQPREHATLGHTLHAVVVPSRENVPPPTPGELVHRLRQTLPPAAVPRSYSFATSLPRNEFGEPTRRTPPG